MGKYASGKRSLAISDRSGMAFPYTEMVREWSLVHTSEFEAKQPQLEPKPVGSDPQALFNPRTQPASVPSLILLDNNPFETIINSVDGNTYINVYSEDHQRVAGSIVRFRGPPEVITAGPGGDSDDTANLQQFANIPTFAGVSDIDSANGFTIQLGQIDKYGIVTGSTTNDVLTNPINYFYFQSADNATLHGVKGGGENCSAGPVTLEVVNG